jgi:photosystem II stability/assembly factor-like uncharacterized protein
MKQILLSCLLFGNIFTYGQWTELTSGTTETLTEIFFPLSGTSQVGYVVGYYGTVLKTTNAGENWESLDTGLDLNFHELHFLSLDEGWIVGDSGSVCHTSDGGMIWDCMFLDSAETIQLHSVFALDNNTVLVGGTKDSVNGFITKTENGGSDWEQANLESYIWDVDIKKIGMVNDETGYAITLGYVLKTIDGGQNWFITDTASVNDGAMFNVLEDLAFFTDSDILYTCGWYGGYFGSTVNGGENWDHNTDVVSQNYNLDFLDSEIGYIGGWGEVHKTSNGGDTFVDASGGSELLLHDIYSIDFTDESHGYACGENGKIIKTSNGGGTTEIVTNESHSLVEIYPTFTTGLINFSVVSDVQMINSNGQIIGQHNNITKLDISKFASGVYFVNLLDDFGNIIQQNRIVKE